MDQVPRSAIASKHAPTETIRWGLFYAHRFRMQQSALNLLLVQKQFELEQELKKHAELLAQTDYLTGLFNRRHFR
jgi:hypothetical protein